MHHTHDTLRHEHIFLSQAHEAHERRTLYVVVLTAAMMVVEIAAGWLTGSMALLADGFHMATHAGALGVAAWAYSFARRHAHSPRFTFGTGKVGDLAGFASALVLAIIAVGIGVESVQRFFEPGQIAFVEATWIAVLGLAVNLASAWLLGHGHSGYHNHHVHSPGHDHGRDRTHDNNLRSAYFHVLADALTSVLAILALLAGQFLGWVWMDAAMGIVGASVIGRWSWGLMRDTGAVLLDAVPNNSLEEEIREAIEDGDARITDLHVWQVGPGKYAAIISLSAHQPLSPSDYAARVTIHDELVHVTVETHYCQGLHPDCRKAA
ncbi:MAG: CDF family Co(II)/Ni(II) efflux transporter DmeF [Sphingomonas sp.]|jgi:cation diffusion facilitator family transporter|uniref:CDF family Co(II)/Ni(II) efflux transporter DmeF n=1 Tax=Sphingomonas sp. TaxID=28214 RepID=UPI002626D18D|nr:CDF family Co(II)/Ni(II) efflux transporter DmeF [Sphingomonas sp.]MDK2767998.1 CDF family Co(II)/Ni(II) efflux transporter DmeF [Sphingomonas sp.]